MRLTNVRKAIRLAERTILSWESITRSLSAPGRVRLDTTGAYDSLAASTRHERSIDSSLPCTGESRDMGSVNKVILVGNVGRDPELRYTPGGAAVAQFSMATTENWTAKSG